MQGPEHRWRRNQAEPHFPDSQMCAGMTRFQGTYIPEVEKKKILKVDSAAGRWVELGGGKRFRTPLSAGDFVVNATEMRAA